MLKWQDANKFREAKLKILANDLRGIRPQGWSVIFSLNEIIVRPNDRTIGKFSITFGRHELWSVTFFSREKNYWNKHKYFDANDSVAAIIKEWMESEVAEPLKDVRSER